MDEELPPTREEESVPTREEESVPTREDAERRIRELLRENDLPQPDEIVPHEDGILCLWHEQKVAVVIELEGDVEDDVDVPTPQP
jgi:hypothetical protein